MDQVVYKHIGRSKMRYSFSCGTTIYICINSDKLLIDYFALFQIVLCIAPQILRFDLGLLVLCWFGVSSSCGLGVTELMLLVYT